MIVKVHLSVSSQYLDAEGRERSENPRCLNSEETEQMYSKHLSVLSIFGHTMLYFYTPLSCLHNILD